MNGTIQLEVQSPTNPDDTFEVTLVAVDEPLIEAEQHEHLMRQIPGFVS